MRKVIDMLFKILQIIYLMVKILKELV